MNLHHLKELGELQELGAQFSLVLQASRVLKMGSLFIHLSVVHPAY